MIKIFFLLIISISLVACDAPRSRTSYSNVDGYSNAGIYDDDDDDSKLLPPPPPPEVNPIPIEFGTCNQSTSQYLGNYYACQNQTQDTQVFIKPEIAVNDRLCIIPMYSSGSNSIYIGNSVCQYISSTSDGVTFDLQKDRSGFEHYTMNAIMIMKDETYTFSYPYVNSPIPVLDAFFICMNTAYYTQTYCQVFTGVKKYQMHNF